MIISLNKLPELREKYNNKNISYTGGVFDILNVGHLDILSKLRDYGDVVVVAVTPDERVRLRKGDKRPIHDQDSRMRVMDAIRYVDYVVLAPGSSNGYKVAGHETLKLLKPDYFLFSADHAAWFKDENWLEEQGTKLVQIPRYSEDVSTTHSINRVLENYNSY